MEIGLVATETQTTFALCLAWDLYPAVGQHQAVPSQWTGLFPVACTPENNLHMELTSGGQRTSAAAFSHSKVHRKLLFFLTRLSSCSSKDISESWGWVLPAVSGLEQDWSQRPFISGQWMKKVMAACRYSASSDGPYSREYYTEYGFFAFDS